ncbi:MAG: cytochrome C assembly family protein [Thiomonas sp.]
MSILVNSLAFALYMLAALLSRPSPVMALGHAEGAVTGAMRRSERWSTWVMALAWIAQTVTFALVLHGELQPHFGFAQALSVTFWLVAAVYWVESLYYPLQTLRSWICVLAAVSILLTWVFPGGFTPPYGAGPTFALHWAMGIAAYGLFGAATLHGILLWTAERSLHRRKGSVAGVSRSLPLLTLEKLTYRLAGVGFVLLTASLIFAATFSEELFGRPFEFNHQAVFGIAAWVLFGILMIGRVFMGWRGTRALIWLFSGTVLLMLTYIGSRFVLQVILHR